jgi:hypothetical protein
MFCHAATGGTISLWLETETFTSQPDKTKTQWSKRINIVKQGRPFGTPSPVLTRNRTTRQRRPARGRLRLRQRWTRDNSHRVKGFDPVIRRSHGRNRECKRRGTSEDEAKKEKSATHKHRVHPSLGWAAPFLADRTSVQASSFTFMSACPTLCSPAPDVRVLLLQQA